MAIKKDKDVSRGTLKPNETLTCFHCGDQAKYLKTKVVEGFFDMRAENWRTSKPIEIFLCKCKKRSWIPAGLIRTKTPPHKAS